MTTIWRFQEKFVQSCSAVLDETLKLLDCDLPHSLFLVGIHAQTNAVTVIPENSAVAAYELEEQLDPPSKSYVSYPDNDTLTNAEWSERFQRHDRSCWECWGSVRDAVASLLVDTDLASAVSPCCEVNGYIVALVATYSKMGYRRYPALEMSVFTDHGRWPSLLFGAVEAVLDKFADELRRRDAGGRYENDPPNARNILRTAGAFFTRIHAWAGKQFSALDIQFRGTLELFDACNVISALPYESREGLGGMVIADVQHPAVDTAICLQLPILATSHKRVRKLLEMGKEGLSLLSNSRYVWGIGTFDRAKYDESRYDVFEIRFVGHYHWEMWHLDRHLMTVKDGEPRLPVPRIDPDVVKRALKRRFQDLADTAADRLTEIVGLVVRAQHGTIIIISMIAQAESGRLARNTGVKPFLPNQATIAGATSIDGAIMIDVDGICHGVGLILDGKAGEGESPARGARYNSVVRYVRNRKDCLGIVVSVDGMIDMLPRQEERARA
jgi:hypothetical protein